MQPAHKLDHEAHSASSSPEEIAEEQPHAMDLDDELFFMDHLPSTCRRWKARCCPKSSVQLFPYNHTERKAILKFIVEGRRFSEVKGTNLWKTMEIRRVCPSRSWQSMKQHFRTYILDHLHQFRFPNVDLAAEFSINRHYFHSSTKPVPLRRPAIVCLDEEEVEENTDMPEATAEEENNDSLQAFKQEEEEDNNDVPQSFRQEVEEDKAKRPEAPIKEEEKDAAVLLTSRGEEEDNNNNSNTNLLRSSKDKVEKEDKPHTLASLKGEDKEESSIGLPQTSEEEDEEEEERDILGRQGKEKAGNPEGHATPIMQQKSKRKISPSRSSSESPDIFQLTQQRHRLEERPRRKRRESWQEEDKDDEEPVVVRYVPRKIPLVLPSNKLDNPPGHHQLRKTIDSNPKEITENQMDGLSSQNSFMSTKGHQCYQGCAGPSRRNDPVVSCPLQRHQTAFSPSTRGHKVVSRQSRTFGHDTNLEEEEEEEEGMRSESEGERIGAGRPSSSDTEYSSSWI